MAAKLIFIGFITLTGIGLMAMTILGRGKQIGKFNKTEALLIGLALTGLGIYLL